MSLWIIYQVDIHSFPIPRSLLNPQLITNKLLVWNPASIQLLDAQTEGPNKSSLDILGATEYLSHEM